MIMVRNEDGERCPLRKGGIVLGNGNEGIVFGT
jgi:hypothetical protein